VKRLILLLGLAALAAAVAYAAPPGQPAPFHPPPFIGGIPGAAQRQAIEVQRHQVQTLTQRERMNPVERAQSRSQLYREALEELRKDPTVADVRECPAGTASAETLCLAKADITPATPAAKVGKGSKAEKPLPTKRRLAVLIGNNDYRYPIPELETPIADIGKIGEILQSRFGYELLLIKNAGKTQIIEALNKIAAEATQDDSVLLFYAGHGYLMEDTRMGFWIPVDASVASAAGWISNTDISKLLGAIKARQVILVSDSCFSGSLTKEQKVTYSGAIKLESVLMRRSVLALSSGGDEPVSDEGKEGHSIFAWNLIRTLQATVGVTPGYEIYRRVHGEVIKGSSQKPQYGAVVSAGHAAGGEYFFDFATVSKVR
jgi:uncharacterized caspase-like protein